MNTTQPVKKPSVDDRIHSNSSSFGKESEPRGEKSEMVSDVSTEFELPKEVEEAGVEHISGTIELPPDVKKLGVIQTDAAQTPIHSPQQLPQVTLPISDDLVARNLHTSVKNAMTWVANWCKMRLKKAHLALKVVHGKVIRVKI